MLIGKIEKSENLDVRNDNLYLCEEKSFIEVFKGKPPYLMAKFPVTI